MLRTIFVSLVVSLALGLSTMTALADGGVKKGQAAPEVAGKNLNGKGKFVLSSFKDKVVFVDFWASWCGPCKEEMPILEKLRKRYGKDGLVIVGVSVDNNAEKAAEFAKKMGVKFFIIHDEGHKIAERYKPAKMPTSFIIDKKGNIAFVHEGFQKSDAKKMEKEIRSLL